MLYSSPQDGHPALSIWVQERRLAIDQLKYLLKIHEIEVKGVVDLVEDKEIELTGQELLPGKPYRFLSICPVLLEGIRIAQDAAKAFSQHVKLDYSLQLAAG